MAAQQGTARGESRKKKPASRIIRRLPLHASVVATLREMIETSELSPGTKINENALCQSLDVSRTPLREALKVLAAEGLIELLPRRGAVVTPIALTEIASAFQVMCVLERLAGELACLHASPLELKQLEEMHVRLVALHRSGARSRYFQLNRQIHTRIVSLARNPLLEATYASIGLRIARARALANHDAWRWQESVDEHERLMEAFRTRDHRLVARCLEEHTQATGEAVLKAIDELSGADNVVDAPAADSPVPVVRQISA